MKNPNGPSREEVECMQQELTDPAILCVMCSNKAVTAAAGIPVCQTHWEAYDNEAKTYPTNRPVFDAIRQEQALRDQLRAAAPYGKKIYHLGVDIATGADEYSVAAVTLPTSQLGLNVERVLREVHVPEKAIVNLLPSSQVEVKAMERAIRPQMAALADAMHCCVSGYVAAAVCWSILGFSVPHNRSKKRLRRLKHSLTILTLQSLVIKT